MAEVAGRDHGARLRRLRWRLRGAWLWPAFVVVTALEMVLLRWLPLAGEGTDWIPALLLAGSLNLMAVALLGALGGIALRRRRPDLPKVVADNYAGTVALALVGATFVAVGLVHRPQLADRRAAQREQSRAVRLWVLAHGDPLARALVNQADWLRVDTDLFRTCVPGIDPRRWLCLIVDTSRSPPRVTRDPSRESNASWNPRGSFR